MTVHVRDEYAPSEVEDTKNGTGPRPVVVTDLVEPEPPIASRT